MLLACYSHRHISYRIRTIIRKAILLVTDIIRELQNRLMNQHKSYLMLSVRRI
ncbi:MAG: hypothetical protein ACRC6C_06840 [Wolbachia pipientis]